MWQQLKKKAMDLRDGKDELVGGDSTQNAMVLEWLFIWYWRQTKKTIILFKETHA